MTGMFGRLCEEHRTRVIDGDVVCGKCLEEMRALVEKLAAALEEAKRGGCWCPVGIGHPDFGKESAKCVANRELLAKAKVKGSA